MKTQMEPVQILIWITSLQITNYKTFIDECPRKMTLDLNKIQPNIKSQNQM